MEKLLLNGDIVSRRIDVGKTVKSFPAKIVLMALLTLFCMLPQKGWAAVYTYDFSGQREQWRIRGRGGID